MNKVIHSQLSEIFSKHYNNLQETTFSLMVEEYIQTTADDFKEKGLPQSSLFKSDMKNLNKYKNNPEIIQAFEKVRKMKLDELKIKSELNTDIRKSIEILNQTIFSENENIEDHSLYIGIGSEDDPEDERYTNGYLYGFTESSFLEEENPYAFLDDDQDNEEEIYGKIGFIDFKDIYKDLIDFENLLKKYELHDCLICTSVYYHICYSYDYKLNLLLNEVFEGIEFDIFHKNSIQKPYYVYTLQFLAESTNIYVYE